MERWKRFLFRPGRLKLNTAQYSDTQVNSQFISALYPLYEVLIGGWTTPNGQLNKEMTVQYENLCQGWRWLV